MESLILGLDISTSCIGFTIASLDNETHRLKIEHINYVKFKNSKKYKEIDALFFKSQQFVESFINVYGKLNITDIIIEEPLISSNNAFSCHQLTKFNGMISQLMYSTFKVVPKYISSFDARKFAFPDLMAVRKYDKEGNLKPLSNILSDIKKNKVSLFGDYPMDCAKKEILHLKVSSIFKDIKWVYNKKNELKVENYDACDSLVCILGYINQLSYNDNRPKIVDFSVEELHNNVVEYIIHYTIEFSGLRSDKTLILNEVTEKN